MELFIEELSKVDFLDIYDDIAAMPLTDAQLIDFCVKCPCKVDLSRGNVVYAVEQKYKAKLSTYSKPKILKWLNAKLPKIVPNPEEKVLKWQEKNQENDKREWLQRKCQALGDLPPPFSGSSDSELPEESITDAQLIELCEKCPCKVDLRRGNVVYAVEQKYKAKLSTYSKPKILKWLKAKLPKIVQNQEKYLKWQEKNQPNAKREWLERKCQALGDLPPPFSGSSDSELSEELSKFDILDIYDDIAAIPLTDAQLIELCEKCPCKVDLSIGNIVHSVEQMYKAMLSTYSKPEILKWLKAKLPKIDPNPGAVYLKWQEKDKPVAKREWLERKCLALKYLWNQ